MDALVADIRYALRCLKSGWFVLAVCVCSLALAVLGNVVVFAIITGLFFRPMPFHDPARLVMIGERPQGDASAVPTAAAANFIDWQRESTTLSAIAAFKNRTLTLGVAPASTSVAAGAVTPGFFSVLGRDALLGRVFEEREQYERVVMLDYRFWQQQYGASPSIVGQEIWLDNQRYSVVGVLPEDFEFLTAGIQVWLPLVVDATEANRDQKDVLVVGRLHPSASMASVRDETRALWQRLVERNPRANRGYDVTLLNVRHDIPDARNRQVFALMQGAMLFVLLIASANVANLLLARGQHRRGEIALRAILGAGRGRIIRQLITESVILALLGSALGLALAAAAVRALEVNLAATLPRYFTPVIDLRVVLFLVALTAGAALAFGLAPSMAVRPDLANALKEDAGRGGSGRRRRLGRVFVVAEIAAALILLTGAGMLAEGFLAVQAADPGFNTRGVLAADIAWPESRYGPSGPTPVVVDRLLRDLQNASGMDAACITSRPPRSLAQPRTPFFIRGSAAGGDTPPHAIWVVASGGYARALGLSLKSGRFFNDADTEHSTRVVVISASLAARHFPGQDPVGLGLNVLGSDRVIVGVLEDVRQELTLGAEGGALAVYVPPSQHRTREMTLLLRTSTPVPAVADLVRRVFRDVDPALPQLQLLPLDQYQARFFAGAQIFTALLSGFGGVALFLATLGTYGVLAYSVSQRTRELGVRMALGATPWDVVRIVAVDGFKTAGIGLVIGVPGTVLIGAAIRSAISGVSVVSSTGVAFAAIVLCTSLLAACVVPAVRAARLDPLSALRAG
jgi:putative ABC transport system permease protein